VLLKIVLLLPIAGLSYEAIRLSARSAGTRWSGC